MNKVTTPVATVAAVAIGAIAFLEWRALELGVDGVLFSLAVASISAIAAGIGGFKFGKK